MKTKILVGAINYLKPFGAIRTRYFYVNPEEGEVKDVTLELYQAIEKFNENARKIRETGKYSLIIPYEFKSGLVEYSHGCGLSHYLQENTFEDIVKLSPNLSFPLTECRISMFTKSDVKDILECKNVFDEKIFTALKERFSVDINA